MQPLFWLLGLVCLFMLWTLASPRSQWWVLNAWAYRDPEANEPSDAGYGVMRVGGGLGLVLLIWLMGTMVSNERQRDEQATAERSEAERADLLEDAFGSADVQLAPVRQVDGDAQAGGPDLLLVGSYVEVDWSAGPPPYAEALGMEGEPALLLVLPGPVEPRAVALDEQGDQVTVTVGGRCPVGQDITGSRVCDISRYQPAWRRGESAVVVPVELSQPLDERELINGATGSSVREQ